MTRTETYETQMYRYDLDEVIEETEPESHGFIVEKIADLAVRFYYRNEE